MCSDTTDTLTCGGHMHTCFNVAEDKPVAYKKILINGCGLFIYSIDFHLELGRGSAMTEDQFVYFKPDGSN